MNKYTPKPRPGSRGRRVNPENWCTGPDPIRREKYYAFLKHRAQAKYRNEPYELTWEQWEAKWSDSDFLNRGRKTTSVCISRINQSEPWSDSNCEVVLRTDHLKRNGEFRK